MHALSVSRYPYQTFRVGHRANVWVNHLFIAQKAFMFMTLVSSSKNVCVINDQFPFRTKIEYLLIAFCFVIQFLFLNWKYAYFQAITMKCSVRAEDFSALARWHCVVASFISLSHKTLIPISHALKSISTNFVCYRSVQKPILGHLFVSTFEH